VVVVVLVVVVVVVVVVVFGGGVVVVVVVLVFVGGAPTGLDGLVGCGVILGVVGGGSAGLGGGEGGLLKSAENATPLPATNATTATLRPTTTVRRVKPRVCPPPLEARPCPEIGLEGVCPGGKPCPAEGEPS
jgi:hypothetical protein